MGVHEQYPQRWMVEVRGRVVQRSFAREPQIMTVVDIFSTMYPMKPLEWYRLGTVSLYRVPVEHNIYLEKPLLLSALLLQYGGKVQENWKGNELSFTSW